MRSPKTGRPKKKLDEDNPKRPVGRPRIYLLEIYKPKRLVGRPRIHTNEFDKLKRPAGRPRKHPAPTTDAKESNV